jgi:diguanylate cyclase (GGDEF)-like protein
VVHLEVDREADVRPSWIRQVRLTPVRIVAATAGSYLLLSWLAAEISERNALGMVTRPAAGVGVAVALLVPVRRWGWIALGLVAAQVGFVLASSGNVSVGVTAAAVVCLEAFVGAGVTRRLGNPTGELVPVRKCLAFLLGAVVVGPVLAAVPGVVALQVAGADVAERIPHLVLSDMLGVLIVAPLVLAPASRVRRSWVERGALYGAFVVACVVVFFRHGDGWGITLPYVLLPLLAWAAFRFGSRATANCGALLYVIANAAVLTDNSPFSDVTGSTFEQAVALRVFVAVAVTSGLFLAAVVEDLVGVKAVQSELRRVALTDHLTSLPNRSRLEQLLETAPPAGCTLLLCDVDHFKRVNDGYGHPAGDRLLVAVAERLRRCLRSEDHLVRLGGDEFVVVVPTVDPPVVEAVASRMEQCVAQPFQVSDRVAVRPTISIGIAGTDDSPVEDLLRHADAALYVAKAAGRHRAQRFDATLRAQVESQTRIEGEIGAALIDGQLGCVFQPEVVLGTQQLFAVEALVRWHHPSRGIVRPDEFVPVMEQLGLADDLFHAVLHQCLAWQNRWQRRHGVRPSVSVNLSPHQLCNTELVGSLVDAVRAAGSEPSDICLEVTEGTLIDGGTGDHLRELSALGFLLAIDDFGTGWASMGRLAAYPWDVLKVDRSFVSGMGARADAEAIVSSAIALAHSLGIRAVAEGVETADQLRRLRALGCDIVQGYLLGEPMDGEHVGRRLGVAGTWRSDLVADRADAALSEAHPFADPTGGGLVTPQR